MQTLKTSNGDEFLNPLCSSTTVDVFVVRRTILDALSAQLPNLRGTLVDIGCGYMPYKRLVLAPPSRVKRYIGIDLHDNSYQRPDLEWDGRSLPLKDDSADCALATEVFEHCPDPVSVMRETLRVLKPGGFLFLTVPFLWPLHCVPHDEWRYTPFAMERHLRTAGFDKIQSIALGGWDRSLAQMIGLWVRRRPMAAVKRAILSTLAVPFVSYLSKRDSPPAEFYESSMITGIAVTAIKGEWQNIR
jgi:SAM-dependent methyltransferase